MRSRALDRDTRLRVWDRGLQGNICSSCFPWKQLVSLWGKALAVPEGLLEMEGGIQWPAR